mmetsp:Transcript_15593/g.36937  ORF Transcript_15593/g.36937 Transcript_15593/m.36937 type:complete len:366 (+) Transcript_15593:95-1192(+)
MMRIILSFLLGCASATKASSAHQFSSLLHLPSPSLSDVAGMLGSLALEEAGGIGALQQMRSLIETLLSEITTQQKQAQEALDEQASLEHCEAAKDAAFQNATTSTSTTTLTSTSTVTTTTTLTTTAYAHPDLAACQAAEQELLRRNESCAGEQAAQLEVKLATCEVFQEVDFSSAAAARAARCRESFVGSYEEYLEQDVVRLQLWRQRQENCSSASVAHAGKQTECQGIMHQLSLKMQECLELEVELSKSGALAGPLGASGQEAVQVLCGSYAEKRCACSNFEACVNATATELESSYQVAQVLAGSRETEFLTLKRIECLLDAFEAQNSSVAACAGAFGGNFQVTSPKVTLEAVCDPGAQPAGCT